VVFSGVRNRPIASAAERRIRDAGSATCEKSLLNGAHRTLRGRLGMVPAADVESAVGDEKQELLGSRPPHIAGLSAPTARGLLGGALDRDDDVAELEPAPGRGRKGRLGAAM
jgi:hypothetical protein